jgi:Cu-Zn family superoxide dismutase
MRRTGWILPAMILGLVGVAGAAWAGKEQEKKAPPPQTQAAGKATSKQPDGKASAAIEGRSGSSLSGTAEFKAHDGMLMITVTIQGAPPGEHAVHIHEKGDCSAPDASSAGGHFNPGGHQHGAPDSPEHHAGDLGNITIAADGTGSLMIHSGDLTAASGPNSVVGHAIIVHEKSDDFVTQPTGNAGGRIGCGVIQAGS